MINFFRKQLPFLRLVYAILRNWRLRLLKWRPTYNATGLITDHLCEFKKDERFRKSFDAALQDGHWFSPPDEWKNHITCWAAEHGANLSGDFIECGVAKGMTSRVIMEYLDFGKLKRKFYLIDTYNGLDQRYLTVNDQKRKFDYPDMYDFVKNTFAKFSNAVIVKGAVPEVLEKLPKIENVAYLHIDMNCMIPEIAAAEYFWPKMSSGAIMILDDYGHQGFDEQRLAFDKFAKEKRVPILSLPTGQALIVKS